MKSKDIADLCKVDFCSNKILILLSTSSCYAHITSGVNIYNYTCGANIYNHTCVPVYYSLIYMCLSMFDIKVPACYDVIRAKPSVNVMPSSIKHTARLCNFKGTKVRQIQARIQQTDSAREKKTK